jgi:hypothetical protein
MISTDIARRACASALLAALTASTVCAADPFIGMAQVTRSDGLRMFVLTGTYRERARCEKLLPELVHKALIEGAPASAKIKLDAAICDTKVPAGSEFAALRGEAPATHVIFFTENFRAMPVHPHGVREDEGKVCDYVKQRVLVRFGVNGECLSPGK